MESPTANNNNNDNLNHNQMTNHNDDQTPPPPPTNNNNNTTNNDNINNNNEDPNSPQCFTNSCYVASEPPTTAPVVVQPQSVPCVGLVMAASQIESLNLNAIDLENGNVVQMTPKERELVQEILVRERRIRELEDALRVRNEEVAELRSHLDKFQSVFPFNNQRGTPVKGIPKFSGIVLPPTEGLPVVAEVGESASAVVPQEGSAVSVSGNSGSGAVTPPPIATTAVVMQHRQRAQGISAEPQSSRSMYELLNVTFPKFDKEER